MTLHRQTSRLLVRPLAASDRAAWVRAHVCSADHFGRWMPAHDPNVSVDAEFDGQLARAEAGAKSGTTHLFVAEHRASRELAAFCSLSQVWRGSFQNAHAGWRVSLPFVRQGIGVEAVTALLDLAFAARPDGLGLHRVQANVIPNNLPSLALARRVGFREEGYALRYLEIDGRWQDHVMFAKLADEQVT